MGNLIPIAGQLAPSWDVELAAGSFYSSANWLRFCDVDDPGSVGTLVADLGAGRRAAVPAVAIRTSPMRYYRWHDILAGFGLDAPAPRGLLIGPSRGYQTRLLHSDGVRRCDAADAVVGEARTAAGDLGGPCIAMYLSSEDVVAFREVGIESPPVLLDTDAWMTIPAGGWDSWLSGLSRHRRTQIRRESRVFDASGYQITRYPLSEVYAKLGRLWAPTQAKYYGRSFDPVELAEQMRVQAVIMGESAKVLLCGRPGEPPVGFCLYYQWGDTVFMRTTGFDYERLAGAAEYFNVSYYHQIRGADHSGVRRIHAGIKSIEAKVHRGARLTPLWLLDLTENSVLLRQRDEVAVHNEAFYQLLQDTSPSVSAAIDHDQWRPLLAAPRPVA